MVRRGLASIAWEMWIVSKNPDPPFLWKNPNYPPHPLIEMFVGHILESDKPKYDAQNQNSTYANRSLLSMRIMET